MGDFVLERLHPFLQQLVLYQRAKRDVKEVLTAVKEIIEVENVADFIVEWSLVHEKERAACRAATLIALRVGAESSIGTGFWSRDRTGYAAIVHACLQNEPKIDDSHSSIKFQHVHPLLSALLSNIEGDSVAVFAVLQAVLDLSRFILLHDVLRNELLSPRFVPLYGKLVSVCLEVLSNTSKDFRCRRLSLTILEALVNASKEDSLSLCVVLPGLSSTLVSTACESANENLDIITTSLEVMSVAVRHCLADSMENITNVKESDEIRPEIRNLLVRRDDEWKTTSTVNITKMIRLLCSTLAVHRDQEVQLTLLKSIDSIRTECKKAFNGTLDSFLLDLLLTTRAANSSKSEIILRLRRENFAAFSLHMHEKLRELAERIPLCVRKGTSGGDVLFHQLAGVLSCLDVDVSRLATSRAPSLQSMFSALSASLRVDTRRLLISRGQSLGSSLEFLKSLPLCFDVKVAWVLPICKLLANCGGIEVVDIAVSEMVESSRSDRVSLAILITLILAELEPQDDSHVLYSLAETCIDWIKENRPEEHTRDDLIEHKIPVPGEETILNIVLVSLLAITFTRIKEEKRRLMLLISFLYELLGLYATSNWIVHDAADCALSQIAGAMSLSVSEFLCERGSYIVHKIALASRSRTEHDHAPIVFSALLERVDDLRMYDHVRHIVEDLLQALDRFKQTYCILILRSMLSFVTAIGRWFPELKPQEEEEMPDNKEEQLAEEEAFEETEKKPPPLPILSVESVLLRTKHLLSSSHFPIRILVMKILREGLWVVRNFDDQLLPMVHQNWEALINRFRDEELEVRREAVKVVTQMVRVSKTFVYRRVRHQMWPLVEKWMRDACLHSYSTTSAAYKYQLLVLQSIAEIFVGIDALSEDVQMVQEMLTLYRNKTGSPELKKEAEMAKKHLERHLDERKQRVSL